MAVLIASIAVISTLWTASSTGAQTFVSVPSDQIVARGETLALTCVAKDVQIISWNLNGEAISEDAGHDLDAVSQNDEVTSTLTIQSFQNSDTGKYNCQGYSQDGNPTPSNFFTVQLATAPTVVREPTTFYANQSETAVLECQSSGVPLPELTWFLDGQELKRSQGGVSKLTYTMDVVTRSDKGTYTCSAKNIAGSDSSTFQLVVNYRPQIISTTASLNLFPMGETRTLSCEVGGIPAPTVSWLFESTPIGSNKTDTGSSVLLFEAKPEQEGTYTCTASNPLGTTSAQLQVQIQGPPGVPYTPVPVGATPTSVFLRWQPGFNGRSEITGYKLEYSEINGSFWYRVTTSAQTLAEAGEQGYELTKLAPNTPYEFRVRAVNRFGRSDFSDPSLAFWTLPQPPKAPKSVRVKGRTTTITVTWKAPTFIPSMGNISGYVVLHRQIGSDQFTWNKVEVDQLEFVIESLAKGTTYEVGVAAENSHGRSDDRKIKYVYVNTTTTTPGKPESCFATATSPSSLELSWHKPHDNGGLDMTKYELEYTPKKGDVNWQLVPGSPTSLHRIVCDGLESGTVYKFKIFAVNANGKGSAANFVGQTINQDGAPPTPDAVRFALVTSSAIEVVWSDPVGDRADAITGYKLQFREARSDDKGWYYVSMMIPASLRTYPVYDLQPRTRYEFRLIATIDRSDSVPSPIAAVNTTAPGDPPVGIPTLDITSITATSFVVRLKTHGVHATGFIVKYRKKGETEWRDKVSHSSSVRQLLLSKLTPNTTYEVKVINMNGQQLGQESHIVEATTDQGSVTNEQRSSDKIMMTIIGAACGVAILIAVAIVCLCCRVQPSHKSGSEDSGSVATDGQKESFRQVGGSSNGSTGLTATHDDGAQSFPATNVCSLPRPAPTGSLLAYSPSTSSVHRDPPRPPSVPDAAQLTTQQHQEPQPGLDASQSGKTSRVPSAIVSPNNAAGPKEDSEDPLPPYNGNTQETVQASQQPDSVDENRPESDSSMSTGQKVEEQTSSPSETEKPDISSVNSRGTVGQEPLPVDVEQSVPDDSPTEVEKLSQDHSLSAVLEAVSHTSRGRSKSKSPRPGSVHSQLSHQTGNASGTTSLSQPSAVTASTANTSGPQSRPPPGMMVRHQSGGSTPTSHHHHHHHHRRHYRRRRSRTRSPGNQHSRRQSPGSNASRQSQPMVVSSQGLPSPIQMKPYMSPVPSQHSSIVSSFGMRIDPSVLTVSNPTQHTVV